MRSIKSWHFFTSALRASSRSAPSFNCTSNPLFALHTPLRPPAPPPGWPCPILQLHLKPSFCSSHAPTAARSSSSWPFSFSTIPPTPLKLGLLPSLPSSSEERFPIVEPDPGHTKLRLSREGLEAIERITNPIAAVALLDFTLNTQILGFFWHKCLVKRFDMVIFLLGFGVGHMRDTKTKGIWVWGTPIDLDINGVRTSVFYLDTEGFESVGKSNVYDDRIFALATVLSSVLIYNLPETVSYCCHLPISCLLLLVVLYVKLTSLDSLLRLSLLKNFMGGLHLDKLFGQDVAFEPAKLLWLIQRDFLQGKSVQEMVNEALRRVPNADGNKNIDVVNQIRDSLAVMGDNSTAFSLPQPHLQRTKLCDMKDVELDQLYIKRREQLKELVASIISPKIVQGKTLTGKEFVSFLKQILEALNKGEIPSTGSLVEVFNKNILEKCLKLYSEKMATIVLPLTEESLQGTHDRTKDEVMQVFDQQHFGRHHAKKSVMQLDEELQQVAFELL
ncbi:hypothetical protein ACSQ67_014977 [Phaseolus vulgaris]